MSYKRPWAPGERFIAWSMWVCCIAIFIGAFWMFGAIVSSNAEHYEKTKNNTQVNCKTVPTIYIGKYKYECVTEKEE